MANKLDADLNIIQRSGIEIQIDPLTNDLNIVQKLDDEPNDVGGLSAQELKAKFDEAGNIIKDYLNGTLVPELLAEGIVEAQRQAAEEDRDAAEQSRRQAEAAREAAQRRFFAGVTASAETLPAGNGAVVRSVPASGSFHLEFGIPEGRQGPPGLNGAALAGDGLFAFNVNDAGHLIVSCVGKAAPDFSVNSDGHLVLNL